MMLWLHYPLTFSCDNTFCSCLRQIIPKGSQCLPTRSCFCVLLRKNIFHRRLECKCICVSNFPFYFSFILTLPHIHTLIHSTSQHTYRRNKYKRRRYENSRKINQHTFLTQTHCKCCNLHIFRDDRHIHRRLLYAQAHKTTHKYI